MSSQGNSIQTSWYSLKFCIEKKGLEVYGWVIMSNHVHLIVSASGTNNLSDILRDFKKFTSKQIVKAIEDNSEESRKNWLLWLLKNDGDITFWRPGNHPEEITTEKFFRQKLDYIHQNPVRAGIVNREEDYVYSSARDYYNIKGLLNLTYFN